MLNTIIGTKSKMTAVFNPAGIRIPVTTVVADPNVVVGIGDSKVVIGFGRKKKSKKTENAQVKAVGYSPRIIKEISTKQQNPNIPELPQQESQEQTTKKISIGDKITVSIFKPGDEVKVTGITKGRGFAGVVKRWGFSGGPKTHGQSDRHRAPGSIGAGTTPGRVFRGKKMAGHMGNNKLTVTRLEIIEVDNDKNLLLVKGAVPGPQNGTLIIEKTGEVKKPTMKQTEVKEVSQVVKEEKEETEGQKGQSVKETNEEAVKEEVSKVSKVAQDKVKEGTKESKEEKQNAS